MRKIVAYVHAYVGMKRNAGSETTLHDLFKFLVKNGWEAIVLVSQPYPGQQEYFVDGVRVIPQTDRRSILHWVPQANVVITHLDNSERAAMLCKKFKTPIVHMVHNDMWQTHGYLATGCDLAIFNTEWVRDRFVEYNGLSVVLHPPVSGADYKIEGTSQQEYITLVNIWPDKGSDTFYKLAEALPDKKFLGVIGGYGVQDLREGYENITFHPHTHDMREVYSKTKIVIMPSTYESYGRIAVEAASNGIPAITSRTPGLVESLGESGIFCDKFDDYVNNIKRLQHWKAYSSASSRAVSRFATLEARSHEELQTVLVNLNTLADTGKILRGW